MNKEGKGPAWSNSLFEDNAEFGYGMAIAVKARRNELKSHVERLASDSRFTAAAREWLNNMDNAETAESWEKSCWHFAETTRLWRMPST